MKSLAEQMRNHDREQMSRMAHNLPEQYQERAPVEQVAQVFNKLFNELRAVPGQHGELPHSGRPERIPPSVAAGVSGERHPLNGSG